MEKRAFDIKIRALEDRGGRLCRVPGCQNPAAFMVCFKRYSKILGLWGQPLRLRRLACGAHCQVIPHVEVMDVAS